MEQLVLGIDLGGTNLRTGIVNSSGLLIDFAAQPIDQYLSGDEIVRIIVDQSLKLEGMTTVDGIGIAVAASVVHGEILRDGLTTLRGLGDFPLCQHLSTQLNKPCVIGNDANLTLLAEAHFGRANGVKNVLLLTLGTGIGGGLLLDGHIHCGSHTSGAEIGLSLVYDDQSRSFQPVENLAAPGAIMKSLGKPNGFLFQYAAIEEEAQQLVERMYEHLGILITNSHLLLDLDLVVISGGLASAGQVLIEGVNSAFKKTCPELLQFDLQIELGMLPADKAGVIGAACLYFEHKGWIHKI
jgi:glucokinase